MTDDTVTRAEFERVVAELETLRRSLPADVARAGLDIDRQNRRIIEMRDRKAAIRSLLDAGQVEQFVGEAEALPARERRVLGLNSAQAIALLRSTSGKLRARATALLSDGLLAEATFALLTPVSRVRVSMPAKSRNPRMLVINDVPLDEQGAKRSRAGGLPMRKDQVTGKWLLRGYSLENLGWPDCPNFVEPKAAWDLRCELDKQTTPHVKAGTLVVADLPDDESRRLSFDEWLAGDRSRASIPPLQ